MLLVLQQNLFRTCESTLRVLRAHSADVMTLLEVFIHDPLFNWSMTPEKAHRLQHGCEADTATKNKWEERRKSKTDGSSKMAEKALAKVVLKLDGVEEGNRLSVEGQVNALIQQARDPERLARLFPGWQAYI